MATAKSKLLTSGDLLHLYSEGVRGELIRGVLSETMPAGEMHGKVVMRLGRLLGNFIEPDKSERSPGRMRGSCWRRTPILSASRTSLTSRLRSYLLTQQIRAFPKWRPTWWSRFHPPAIVTGKSTIKP